MSEDCGCSAPAEGNDEEEAKEEDEEEEEEEEFLFKSSVDWWAVD